MVKKISAIVLALVLCLSVVVMPASAYELASGSVVAYVVELDKEYYSAGDTVTVNLYIYGDENTEFNGGALVFGCHSSVFAQADNAAADVKASATTGDNASTFYKQFSDLTWAWQTNTTIYNNIVANNTAEENQKFDQFIKVAPARLSTADGTHENSQNSKHGYYGSDFNAESDAGIPFVSFQLKLRDDLADGTKIEIGIPKGPMAKNYTYMDTFKTPGTATTKVKTTAANSEVVWSTNAVIGKATVETTPLEISHWKNQIRFETKADGSYYGVFDGRILMSIDNFDEVFASITDAEDAVIDAGFIFAKSTSGAALDEATAQAQVKGEGNAYSQVKNAYVSTAFKDAEKGGKGYVMSCMIDNVADADKATVSLSAMAYVIYTDANGETAYAFSPVETSTFESLYNSNFSQAFPNA